MDLPIPYRRQAALDYARRWAFSRNPAYLSFNGIGGDCTNFVSQCLLAGGMPANTATDVGWYYRSANDRAAAWSSVFYLHRFLTNNQKRGPVGREIPLGQAEPGDLIQLGDEDGLFYHTLLITAFTPEGEPLIATHSVDSLDRPLGSYEYARLRSLKILGGREK